MYTTRSAIAGQWCFPEVLNHGPPAQDWNLGKSAFKCLTIKHDNYKVKLLVLVRHTETRTCGWRCACLHPKKCGLPVFATSVPQQFVGVFPFVNVSRCEIRNAFIDFSVYDFVEHTVLL